MSLSYTMKEKFITEKTRKKGENILITRILIILLHYILGIRCLYHTQYITERTLTFLNCHFIIGIEIGWCLNKMSNLKVLLNLGFKEHSVLLNNQGDRLAPFSHSRFYLKDNFSFFKNFLFSLNKEAIVVGR